MKVVMTLVFGGASVFLAAELICRLLPVNIGRGKKTSDRFAPLLAAEPGTVSYFSKGWNFQMSAKNVMNSDGFNCDQDFPATGSNDVIAVIGDSYIESLMIDQKESLQSRLQESFEGSRVVGLGLSGANMGTYDYLAQKASELWGLKSIIVVTNEEDIREAYTPVIGLSYYQINERDEVRMVLPERYDPNRSSERMIRMFKKSRFLQYVSSQLGLRPSSIKQRLIENELSISWLQKKESTNEEGSQPSAPIDLAIDSFLGNLSNLQKAESCEIIILINGHRGDEFGRSELVSGEHSSTLRSKANSLGMQVVDGYQILKNMAKKEKIRPHWITDAHWTPEAHAEIAKILTNLINNK